MIRHRKTLQQGKLIPSGLGENYGSIRSIGENETVIAVYRDHLSVELSDAGACYLFNASTSESILIETDRRVCGEKFDVLGNSCGQISFGPGPAKIPVPVCGSLRVDMRKNG